VDPTRRELLLAAAATALVGAGGVARAGAAGPTAALVTADLEAAVLVADPRSALVRRRLATPPGPRSIERVGPHSALVAHTEEGAISLVDAREPASAR
jgi:hypothetical protein